MTTTIRRYLAARERAERAAARHIIACWRASGQNGLAEAMHQVRDFGSPEYLAAKAWSMMARGVLRMQFAAAARAAGFLPIAFAA